MERFELRDEHGILKAYFSAEVAERIVRLTFARGAGQWYNFLSGEKRRKGFEFEADLCISPVDGIDIPLWKGDRLMTPYPA